METIFAYSLIQGKLISKQAYMACGINWFYTREEALANARKTLMASTQANIKAILDLEQDNLIQIQQLETLLIFENEVFKEKPVEAR